MKTIVLAGAGHANIVALQRLKGFPARLVLVNEGRFAWYTGALPAVIRGEIPAEAARLDVALLAARCGAEFLDARVEGFEEGRLFALGFAPLGFDILAVSTGGPAVEGGVKPIPALLARVERLAGLAAPRIGILGLGAAGVELALALRVRCPGAEICAAGREILPGAPARAQLIAARELANSRVCVGVGLPEGLDEVIHAYAAEPELVVDEWLRVAGFETVFAAGDAARMAPPAARSGAVAVRQGRVLGENLRRMAEGRGLAPFAARGPGLAILGLDERRAVGWFRGVVVEGRWVMGAKKWLDGRWVRTAK